jgi:hypothetical protein
MRYAKKTKKKLENMRVLSWSTPFLSCYAECFYIYCSQATVGTGTKIKAWLK